MKNGNIQVLRCALLVAGLGWGATIVGIVLPWEWATHHLEVYGGAVSIPNDPMLNYWMRMAAGAFGIIGVLFILASINPHRYQSIIPVLGYGSLMEGVVLLSYGVMFDLPWFPFWMDLAIAFIPAFFILVHQGSVKSCL